MAGDVLRASGDRHHHLFDADSNVAQIEAQSNAQSRVDGELWAWIHVSKDGTKCLRRS